MEEKENILKKWWFWAIIVIILIVLIVSIAIKSHIKQKKLEENFETIGSSATDYIEGINSAKSHLDEFTYNYETGTVEYKPSEEISDTSSSSTSKKPTDLEIISYAQTVLKDNLDNPKYSYGTSEYKVVNTLKRYKIEGIVNNENFWMIIEFTDDTYETYDLISLQVGNDIIYKK